MLFRVHSAWQAVPQLVSIRTKLRWVQRLLVTVVSRGQVARVIVGRTAFLGTTGGRREGQRSLIFSHTMCATSMQDSQLLQGRVRCRMDRQLEVTCTSHVCKTEIFMSENVQISQNHRPRDPSLRIDGRETLTSGSGDLRDLAASENSTDCCEQRYLV